MKSLRKLSLTNLVAAVAAAGLSLSAAYAAPSYSPDVNSPINSPDGGVDLGAGLALINAQLTGTATLILPAVNGGAGFVKPTKPQFLAAVKAAAAAAGSDSLKAAVVNSALAAGPAYGAAVTKDVVRQVLGDYLQSVGYTQAGAIAILEGALNVNNGKSKDAMTGAILAFGDFGSTAEEQDADEVAAAAFVKQGGFTNNDSKKAASVIEGLAEVAIKSMKPSASAGFNSATLGARVSDTVQGLVNAAEGAGASFLLDDVIKGSIKGAKSLISSGVSQASVYGYVAAAVAPDAVSQAHGFAGVARTITGTDTVSITAAKLAFGNGSAISAVSDAYFGIANATTDLATLVAGDPPNAANFAIGAAYIKPGAAISGIAASINNAGLNLSLRQAMVAGASRAANSSAGKIAAASTAAGGLSAAEALAAALPNAPVLYAGSIAKEVTKVNTAATEASLVTAAIDALEGATAATPENDFLGGIVDVIGEISKIRKTAPQLASIINAGIAALPNGSGRREAIAAAIGRQDKAGTHDYTTALSLAGASPGEIASVIKADAVAKAAKTNTKAALNLAQFEMRTGPVTNLNAVLLGVGAVDKKLVNVLLANALRLGDGTLTSGDKALLLNNAKSLNKAAEADVQLAYNVATLVLADPDNSDLFDIVSQETLINPKGVATVATAAAAAAPKYAHYVARAAAFRAGAAGIAKVPLAVIQGADMNSNLTSNPSAVAAIAAGFVCGIKDAKNTSILENKMMTAGMTAMVKAVMGIGDKGTAQAGSTPPSGSFASVNIDTGLLGGATQPEYGSAAAVTGLTSILSNTGDALPSAALIAALTGAGKAVGHGPHSQMTVIAQAAMQAFVFVTGTSTNAARDAIIGAIGGGAGALGNPAILAAANAGRAQALIGGPGNFGAGAAGVVNYAHFNCNNGPVTDIAGF